jgi:hypothetical protein
MSRHTALVWLVLALAHPVALPAAEPAGRANVAGLEDRLNVGLRTRLPSEKAFVEKVATLVRAGRLPGKLVDSTYLWAVGRRTEYPFPAFEKALRIQAARLGVGL